MVVVFRNRCLHVQGLITSLIVAAPVLKHADIEEV